MLKDFYPLMEPIPLLKDEVKLGPMVEFYTYSLNREKTLSRIIVNSKEPLVP